MENRKTILFLGSLFLGSLIIGMLYVDLIQRNVEGVCVPECPQGTTIDETDPQKCTHGDTICPTD